MTTNTYEALRKAEEFLFQAASWLKIARNGKLADARAACDKRGENAINAHASALLCSRALIRAEALVLEAREIIA